MQHSGNAGRSIAMSPPPEAAWVWAELSSSVQRKYEIGCVQLRRTRKAGHLDGYLRCPIAICVDLYLPIGESHLSATTGRKGGPRDIAEIFMCHLAEEQLVTLYRIKILNRIDTFTYIYK